MKLEKINNLSDLKIGDLIWINGTVDFEIISHFYYTYYGLAVYRDSIDYEEDFSTCKHSFKFVGKGWYYYCMGNNMSKKFDAPYLTLHEENSYNKDSFRNVYKVLSDNQQEVKNVS
jgi:hypothetical protein